MTKKQYNNTTAKIEKKASVFDHDIFDALADESDQVKAETLYLLKDYDKYFCESGGGKEFNLKDLIPEVRLAFKCNKKVMERYGLKWLAAVERNRRNGAKGGRPRKTVIDDVEDYLEQNTELQTPDFNDSSTHNNDEDIKQKNQNNPMGKNETQEKPQKPNQGLKEKGLKDSGCGGFKESGKGTGKDCISCVQLVQKFIWGEIGIEFKDQLPPCSPGCRLLAMELRKKPNAKGSATPTANSARQVPTRPTVSKF